MKLDDGKSKIDENMINSKIRSTNIMAAMKSAQASTLESIMVFGSTIRLSD